MLNIKTSSRLPLTADSISPCKQELRVRKSSSRLKPPDQGHPFCGWDLFPKFGNNPCFSK